ncbi:TonB family protein [Paraburkholderia bannensis]|uniref:TonB family protein n=1 Tax=Paraburkholderia bannensis TaxID=765414 RepID=UPI002AB6E196|nr:TonB family protein [Paraburkholderia bannensis]
MATVPMIPMQRVASGRLRLAGAAAMALCVEAALMAGVWAVLAHRSAPPLPPERKPTMLSIASVAAPAPTPSPPAVTKPAVKPAVKPSVKPKPVEPVHRVVHATPPPEKTPAAVPAPTPAPVPVPTAAEPAPVTHAPAQPATAAAPAGPGPNFAGKLRAAIQAALHYPESARMSGVAGRTRVAFTYCDGVVSEARVVVSSGVALLDRAALAAVRDADYPKPEPAFAGKALTEQLWVNFNLDEQE